MNPILAEFIATAVLILFGGGVVANVLLKGTKGNGGGWIVITTAWALAVFMGVTIAGPYSGAHLNPAVSVALAIKGTLAWDMLPYFVLAQISGACFGAFLVWVSYKNHYDQTEDSGLILATFSTGPAIRSYKHNLLSELIATFVLIFSIFFITGAEITDTKSPIGLGSVGAIPVAFLVWVIGLSLGGTTGYAINPARDLGPRIMHTILPIKHKGTSDWAYAWVPILGPIIGAILATLCYQLIFQ